MNEITRVFFFTLFFLITSNIQINAQGILWEKSHNSGYKDKIKNGEQYAVLDVNNKNLENLLKKSAARFSNKRSSTLIDFPDRNGDYKSFVVYRTKVMHPYLEAKYSNIKTYIGKNVEDQNEVIRFTYCSEIGLRGNITNPGKQTIVIKPINKSSHIFYASDKDDTSFDFDCQVEKLSSRLGDLKSLNTKNANDGKLRRYRLALSVSGDYAQYFLNGTEVNDSQRKTKVMAAMVASINRVNGIFERDFGVTMQIIPQNNSLIFLDPLSDPYTTGDSLNGQLQNTLDTNPAVGSSAYDVGHLFHKEAAIYGNAGCIACVCTDGSKGSAFTVHSEPDSDNFNLIVAHEFGHQFGGYHVQSSPICRSGVNSEVEPGSGSSIMGYAGICSPNVQNAPDDYFNYVDIRDVAIWTINNSDCAEIISTNNTAPVANAGSDFTIPKSTPFVLDGVASDIDGSASLTYCWEQNNPEIPPSSDTPQPSWVNGPLFRSKLPSGSTKRYMPQLEDVLSGNLTPTWEVLPSVSRTMKFEFTVRDNDLKGGQTSTDNMSIVVDGNSGPFQVTSQNTPDILNVGELVTVNWEVANTNQAPVNASAVDILLSIDGGYTYPYVLMDDTVNDGSETFELPRIDSTSRGRIMVRASNNIFFAVNSSNFSIEIPEFTISILDDSEIVCQTDNATYNFEYKTFLQFEEEVVFSAEGLPVGATINFNPASVIDSQIPGVSVEANLSSTENFAIGQYIFFIKGVSTSGIEKRIQLTLETYKNDVTLPVLVLPSNNETGIALDQSFQWQEDNNSETFEIQIATDSGFSNIIESSIVSENSYAPQFLENNVQYFWRVRSVNPCRTSEFSIINSFATKCSTPLNFEYTTISASSVELSWMDNNSSTWELEYGFSGFTLGTGTVLSVSTNPYEIKNLNPITSYDVYIKANCIPGGDSNTVGPISFKTLCDETLAPFSESFEEYNTPQCWVESGTGSWNYNTFAGYDAALAGDRDLSKATNYAWIDGTFSNGENQISILETPLVDVSTLAAPSIQFSVFSKNTVDNTYNSLEVSFYDGANWNTIFQIQENTGGWRDIAIDLDEYAITGPIQVRFKITGNSPGNSEYNDILIDEIKIDEMPSCLNPYTLEVSNIKARSIDVSWIASGAETNWEIQYGLQGFILNNGMNQSTITTSKEITGLEPTTTYDVYVRAACGLDGNSNFIGPFTFTTDCDPFAVPFEENFSDFSRPQCWQEKGNANWYFDKYFDNGIIIPDRSLGNQTNYARKYIDFSNSHKKNYLITPYMDISTLVTPSVQFSIYSNHISNGNYNGLVVEFFDGTNWNVLLNVQESTNGWKDYYFDLSSYTITDDIKIRFEIIDNTSSSEYNYVLIDDVKIGELPSCFNPNSLTLNNVTYETATFSWNKGDNENNWQLEYGKQGFVQGTGTIINTQNNPETISGLESNTSYDVYIRSNCEIDGFSDWIGPISFKTYANYCGGRFYDSGGVNGDYSNNENETTVIAPGNDGDLVKAVFDSFSLENCCDVLSIYDGPDVLSPLIGEYKDTSPGIVVSTHETGMLTFVFRSDGSVTSSGWDAQIICESKPTCSVVNSTNEYIENGSFECDALDPWRSIGPGSNSGCRMNFTVLRNSESVCVLVPEISPTDGYFAAYTSFDGNASDTYVLEQSIKLPQEKSSITSANISFDFKVEYSVTFGTPTEERTLTAGLYDTSNNLITIIDEQSFGINPQTGNLNVSVTKDVQEEIMNYDGQDIIIRFTAYIPDRNTGPAKALIDNVSFLIETKEEPQPEEEEEEEEVKETFGTELTISPNPTKVGKFILTYGGANQLERIVVFDITGKMVHQEQLNGFDKQKEILTEKFKSGMYLVKVISNKGIVVRRLIVK